MMDRRTFTRGLSTMLSAAAMGAIGTAGAQQPTAARGSEAGHVAMLLFPGFIPLDLFGPQACFALLGGVQLHYVWKSVEPVQGSGGAIIQPTMTFADCPEDLEILFVPGGLEGTIGIMNDDEVLAFLADRGARARYVTGVCNGPLALAAAGLLRGYRATTHWQVQDLLPLMGAEAVAERVVIDRNRITGAGVTSGIDFGLAMVGLMRGEEQGRRLELLLEYDPAPPFGTGHPRLAGIAMADDLNNRRNATLQSARAAALRARDRLGMA